MLEGKIALQMATSSPAAGSSRWITVEVIGTAEIAGSSAVVEPHRYTLTGVCLQSTRALSISATRLRGAMLADPSIGYEILTGLTRVIATRLGDTRQALVGERMLVTDDATQQETATGVTTPPTLRNAADYPRPIERTGRRHRGNRRFVGRMSKLLSRGDFIKKSLGTAELATVAASPLWSSSTAPRH